MKVSSLFAWSILLLAPVAAKAEAFGPYPETIAEMESMDPREKENRLRAMERAEEEAGLSAEQNGTYEKN